MSLCLNLEHAVEMLANLGLDGGYLIGAQWNVDRESFDFAVFATQDEADEFGYVAIGAVTTEMLVGMFMQNRPSPETVEEFSDPLLTT